ncbi:DUF1987 domain-containing protein [Vicingaceae bacterium]|nr:DUF1987 domain-containing protein [Vicingaceae bacterium]
MKQIEIKGTEKSPKFILEPTRGSIKILGRSTMLNPHEFYHSTIRMLVEYSENPPKETNLFIDLEYYNTLSSRYILNILKIISRINHQQNSTAKIVWYVEEDDIGIRDDIKLFSDLINHKIHMIEYEMAY